MNLRSISCPIEHFRLLNPNTTAMHVVWTKHEKRKKWHLIQSDSDLLKIMAECSKQDVYITPNSFWGFRRTNLLQLLNAQFVDLDVRDGSSPIEKVARAMSSIHTARIPEPNLILWTGRGAHLYWLLTPTQRSKLQVWKAIQQKLINICDGDKKCTDAPRLLRLAGSINSASGTTTRGELFSTIRHEIDWLADQVGCESDALQATRPYPKKETRNKSVTHYGRPISGRWKLVLDDLKKIIQRIWNGIVPYNSSKRDLILFYAAIALSWTVEAHLLEEEVMRFANFHIPSFSPDTVKSYMSTVVAKAIQTEKTGREERYKLRRETLYREFEDLIPIDLIEELRAIVPRETSIKRKREADRIRIAQRRLEQGRPTRGDCHERKNKGIEMLSSGFTNQQVAAHFGITGRTVQNWRTSTKNM